MEPSSSRRGGVRAYWAVAALGGLALAAPFSASAGTPIVRANFTAVSVPAINLDTFTVQEPPDTMGAVGPRHFVQFLNQTFTIHSKNSGATLTTVDPAAFWSNAGVDLGDAIAISDPRVLYDPHARRWFASMVDVFGDVDYDTGEVVIFPDNNFLFAVSLTPDPAGAWKGFKIQTDPSGQRLGDFPRLGLNAKGVYLSTDNFQITPEELQAVTILSIPKADLIGANPNIDRMTRFDTLDPATRGQALQPVVDYGKTSSRAVVIAVDNDSFGLLRRSSILDADTASAVLTDSVSITVPATAEPPKARQPDGAGTIDSNDSRFDGFAFKVGDGIWAVHAIGFPTTSRNPRGTIRWYHINEIDNTLVEPAGTIGDTTHDLYFPSIAANPYGDVVIGFTRSSPTEYPSAYAVVGAKNLVTGNTDFGDPILLKAGFQSYDLQPFAPNRWGDYSATHVDPADPWIFWTIQEYSDEDSSGFGLPQWATQVAEIIIPHANESRWTAASDGTFADDAKWLQNAAPGVADHAIFSVATDAGAPAYVVALDASVSNNRLSVRQGSVVLDLNGHAYTLTNASAATPSISVGEFGGDPDLTVSNGILSSVNASLATSETADVLMTVQNATWTNSATLAVGGTDLAAGGNATLTLASNAVLTVGSLRIWDTGAVNSAGTLLSAVNITNSGTFSHTAGTLAVTGAFTNSAGQADIGAIQNWGLASSLIISGGQVQLNSDAGPAGAALSISISAASQLVLNSSQHLKSLLMTDGKATLAAGGSKILAVNALALSGASQLDLADNDMVVRALPAERQNVLAAVTGFVQSSRNAPGNYFNGPGLASSTAAADPAHHTSLGVILNDKGNGQPIYTTFDNEPVDINTILVKFTWDGDADLTGKLDANDYFQIDFGFANALTGWRFGDFDYSGSVDANDYFRIDSAFAIQSEVLGMAAVPEPAGLVGIAAALLLLNRRRVPNR